MTEDRIRRELEKRLLDYDRMSLSEMRGELTRRWRETYPDAAAEPASAWQPLARDEDYSKASPNDPDENWFNETYTVTLRRHKADPVFGSSQGRHDSDRYLAA